MESPLCEVIIEGTKVQPPKRPLRSSRFKGFTQDDVNIAKSMVRIHILRQKMKQGLRGREYSWR